MKSNIIGTNGPSVTEVGLGTGPLGGLYKECTRDTAMGVLEHAWSAGVRYFDTAPFYGYGLAERRVGDFLQGKRSNEWALSTKVGRLLRLPTGTNAESVGFVNALDFEVDYDYSYDGIMRSVEFSYARLGLTKIDIAYIHDIGNFNHAPELTKIHLQQLRDGGFEALNKLKSTGAIKAFGIGVNEVDICLTILDEADLDCILLAGRYTLLDRTAEAELLPLCRQRGVSIISGGVFNSGILATGAVAGAYFDYAPATPDILDRVSQMETLAAESGSTLAQAALSFPLHEPVVKSLLLGADNVHNLKASLRNLDNRLPSGAFEKYRDLVVIQDLQ